MSPLFSFNLDISLDIFYRTSLYNPLNRFLVTFIFQHAEEVKLADERKLIDEVMQEWGSENILELIFSHGTELASTNL